MPTEQSFPRVFISYSHDSPQHESKVLTLSNRLRGDGVDALIDQYEAFPLRGWPHWMRQQIEEARFVLVVCTKTYRRRMEGKEAAGKGLGVVYEGSIIDQDLFETGGENNKFIPVVLSKEDGDHRPTVLRQYRYFNLASDYEDLYRVLTNQPKTSKPALGKMRALKDLPQRLDYRNTVWNIPPRNLYFSGRNEYIEKLHNTLAQSASGSLKQPQAIRGLGGIGKTQTAIEFAHRYQSDYSVGTLITADSPEALVSGFASFGTALGLEDEQDLGKAAQNGKQWFEDKSGWLLILDNVENWAEVKKWIPQKLAGHVLITTRLSSTGTIAKGLDLPTMTPEEGLEFLLKRSKIENTRAQDSNAAREISIELGGLPLALDQAGAYIEEAGMAPAEYLSLYRFEGEKLRSKPGDTPDHKSITVTFTLAFQRLSDRARELVERCAFLGPDAIPTEILTSGEKKTAEFYESLREALKQSLIGCSSPGTIDIHRLVQAVVRDGMDIRLRQRMAQRIVKALRAVFPHPDYRNWPRCERLLAHVQAAAQWIEEFAIKSTLASKLLNRGAWYIFSRARFEEAARLFHLALNISKQRQGPEGLEETTRSLNGLAVVYRVLNRYAEAEQFGKRALAIRKRKHGLYHRATAISLVNLALVIASQKRFTQAERLLSSALRVREAKCGPKHRDTAYVLNDLAEVYAAQHRYKEAEDLHNRTLAIRKKVLPPNHPETASSLLNLAGLYWRQKRYKDAKSLYRQALKMFETVVPWYSMSSFSTLSSAPRKRLARSCSQDAISLSPTGEPASLKHGPS